ncbi:AfsR/SARP family transcriptional regulator [Streptomyces sedi]|uniref:OmpR/PhoB-type domain-containing protein n=1 Tax=Streptomyces sedi TaxID=555059 RepID=A0A5C4VCJ2_9ACTN|nr:BTAD domain-containing putative transcriptional regulator [Streptomyces sedi]TNM33502.1 hypothetical protein FH715_03875 [Streptomyces sedi]
MVNWRVLGPLEIVHHGRHIDAGPPQRRAVLGILLLARGKPVSRGRITRLLWGDDPPASPTNSLRTHVSRLRQTFRENGLTADHARLLTVGDGYRLTTGDGSLDLVRFERLTCQAKDAPDRTALPLFESAFALWRGPMLPELSSDVFRENVLPRYEEVRLTAYENHVDARLRVGEHVGLVPELLEFTQEFPYRTRLRIQLMLSLYRCGRGAEALTVYRDTRGHFSAQLGLDAPAELRALESLILTESPSLTDVSHFVSMDLLRPTRPLAATRPVSHTWSVN